MIPPNIRKKLRHIECRILGVNNDFKNMRNEEIFDKIYNEGIWGRDKSMISTSGGGSHIKEIINPYITKVSDFLKKIKPSVIVDLGCGDFNVGSKFVSLTDRYIACDVSNVILRRNKDKFSSLKNVEFKFK